MNKNKNSYLHSIVGPMFAGKTAFLIKKIQNLQKEQNKNVLIIKPEKSCRFSKHFIVAHNGENIKAKFIKKTDEVLKMVQPYGKFDVVAFDELHFFSLSFLIIIKKLLKTNHIVIACGLDKGFSDHNLPIMNKVIAISDHIDRLKGKCYICHQPSTKTQAIDKYNQPLPPLKVTKFAGGKEKYQTRCQKCYVKFSWKRGIN